MRVLLAALLAIAGCDRGTPSGSSPPSRAPEPPPTSPAIAAPANDNTTAREPGPPLLWVVHAKAGTSYLFGTMHMGVDVNRDVSPLVFELLADAKTYVMEADVSNIDRRELMQLSQLPGDIRLDEALDAEQWKQLAEIVPLFPEAQLRRFQPWFVIVAIAQTMVPQTDAMDGVLAARARRDGIDIAYLESWQYQIRTLNEIMGVADLVDTLENIDDTKQELLDLAAAYVAGDADAIAKILFDPVKHDKNPKIVDVLLTKRNREWLPALSKRFDAGNAFIAVGVGHLIGDEGVVALLRERGYQVERFKPPAFLRQERRATPAAGAP